MISPEGMGKNVVLLAKPFSVSPVLTPGALSISVSNQPECDWLYMEGIAHLPTKTHRPLELTGASHGMMIQLRAIMVFTQIYSVLQVFPIYFPNLGCIL